MGCSHSSTCELYRYFTLAPVLEIWKLRYCNSDTRHLECARFKLSLQKKPVPPTLLPNGELLPVSGPVPKDGQCGP